MHIKLLFAVAALFLICPNHVAAQQKPSVVIGSLLKDAKQGDPKSQLELAAAYLDGHGVPQDFVEAIKWFRKAADQGYAEAQNWLGKLYYDGNGVPQDYAEAMKWYRKAAGQGHGAAQINLEMMKRKGIGVPQNRQEP